MMKLQEQQESGGFQTDTNDLYHSVGDDSFFVNYPCILATNSTITIGSLYILIYSPAGTKLKLFPVQMLNVSFEADNLKLELRDIFLQRKYQIKFYPHYGEIPCHFYLVDLQFLQQWIDTETIRKYCAKY